MRRFLTHHHRAFFVGILAFLLCAYAMPANANPKYASIVIDADTGVVLSERYADKTLHPASLTKMMTLLLTFEALDKGAVRLTDRIKISHRAASMVPSKLGLPAGYKISIKDAIYALVTKSANDVAVALAEHLGGSEARFATMMTTRARTIGMRKTRFKNASGLHNKYQVSSARDMSKLARYMLQRYPHYYKYFSTKNFTYRGKTYRNHNRLLDSYAGMDGFKTGYINASGFNLVASAKRNGRRIIGVVFGGRTSRTRNDHMVEILDSGFKKANAIRFARFIQPPKPTSKPLTAQAVQIASHQTDNAIKPDYVAITQKMQNGAFEEMMGQGDIDHKASKRIETGLIAMAMHTGDYQSPANDTRSERVAITPINAPHKIPAYADTTWSVQIGAYTNHDAAYEALFSAKKLLPQKFVKSRPIAIPLRTAQGVVYRARLSGLTETEAQEACRFFNDCMAVMPLMNNVARR